MDTIKDAVEGVKKMTVGDASKPEISSSATVPTPADHPVPSDKKASKKDKKVAGGAAPAAATTPSAPANPLEVGS